MIGVGSGASNLRRSMVSLATALALVLPAAAQAIDCRKWTAMTSDQQIDWLSERIRWGVVESADARKIRVNRVAMQHCMMSRRPTIVEELDFICDEGIQHSRYALDDRLQRHFWSCVGAENG